MKREEALSRRDRVRYNLLNREDKEAVDIAFDALERSGWISVKDRLPERYIPVLTCRAHQPSGKVVELGFLDISKRWKIYGTRIVSVTHWMPLPEPPEED